MLSLILNTSIEIDIANIGKVIVMFGRNPQAWLKLHNLEHRSLIEVTRGVPARISPAPILPHVHDFACC
jgi:hypothetical protein